MFDLFEDDPEPFDPARHKWLVTACVAIVVGIWGLALFGAYALIFWATCP